MSAVKLTLPCVGLGATVIGKLLKKVNWLTCLPEEGDTGLIYGTC